MASKKELNPFFKKIFDRVKQHNYIAIGGAFGIGKSTLTVELAKELKLKSIMEIDEEDEFTKAILTTMYSKSDTWIDGTTNEWFTYKRYQMHQEVAKMKSGLVLDGTIFQQPVISNIMDTKKNQNAFDTYVRELCEKVAYRIGIPKFYVILDAPWKVVKQRIVTRGRPYEVENFTKNEKNFKKLTEKYAEELKKQCEIYRIPFIVIDSRKSVAQQIKIIKKYMKLNNIKISKNKENSTYLPLVKCNAIAIGGMIGAGKSTLTRALAVQTGWEGLQELKDNDPWHISFLKEFYQKRHSYIKQMFQSYMPQYRIKSFKEKLAKSKSPLILDRTIFEDRIFADFSIDDPKILKFYNRLWYDMANDLAYNTGLPKLYILLDIDFETFKKRIFERGRASEIDNFAANENYFKMLHKDYTEKMVELCQRFEIEYLIVDAKLKTEEQVEKVMAKIHKLNINK